MKKSGQNVWPWVGGGVIVVVLAILVVAEFLPTMQHGAQPGSGASSTALPTFHMTQNPLILASFPAGIVLNASATVESTGGGTSTSSQLVASWVSTSSTADLAAYYKNYFSKNGWTATSQATQYSSMQVLNAKKGSSLMNVIITGPAAGGASVSLSYKS